MPHARLTHPSRPTLPFRAGQQDEYSREAVANIANELGTDRTSLVHTETRDSRRTIRGTVSAPRRARNDADTSEWLQALANYVDTLESHVNEFQGSPGYTVEDDQLDISKSCVIEGVEWSLTPGKIYEVDYETTVAVGEGTFESGSVDPRNPTVDTGMNVMLRVDGNDLPGFRDYRVRKEIGTEVKGIFDRESAENNDVLIDQGVQQTVAFEGVHSGSRSERASADAALDALVASENSVTLETRFPGYSLDGFVTAYSSTFEQQRTLGDAQDSSHRYRVEFTVGQRA